MFGYIYMITNLHNNKTYIGQRITSNIDVFEDPYMGSGILIKKAIKAYGKDSFTKTILVFGEFTRKELCELEKYYISYYKNINMAEYNIAIGGEGGNLGAEVNKRISIASKRSMEDMELRERISKKLKGRKLSDARNRKCAETHRGMKWYNNGVIETQAKTCPDGYFFGRLHKKPKPPLLTKEQRSSIISNAMLGNKNPRALAVKCIELNKEFLYIKEAVYYLMTIGILSEDKCPQQYITKISNCCKGITTTAFGYTWEFCHLPHCNSGKDFVPSRMLGA